MAKRIIDEATLTSLADAVRAMTGITDPLTLDDVIRHIQETGGSVTINTAAGNPIQIVDCMTRKLHGLTIYGKTIQNGTPTPEAPVSLESVGDSGAINTTVAGKNLFDSSVVPARTSSGITTSLNADGSIHFEGTATSNNRYIQNVDNIFLVLPAGTYTVSPNNLFLKSELGSNVNRTFTLEKETRFSNGFFSISKGDVFSEDIYIQIEEGTTATAYEPYKPIQTLTASTPNGLPGIPVSGGGNYTDANGQRWICDEIDFARGKYVNRIGRITSYAGETITSSFLSTTGSLTSDATVLYVLPSPIEADLSVEELVAYSALHTNYPQTVIYNDADAWMSVKYVVDVAAEADYQDALREMGVDV